MKFLIGVVMVVCFLAGLMPNIEAHLNLFMNASETKRLLGIVGELYYVRNGIVNEYALQFAIPIKPDTDDIYFDWQCLRKPTEQLMYYRMAVSVSNPQAMRQPTINIPPDGPVPSQPSVFSINLPCTGQSSTDVDIRISLNVSLFSTANVTSLELRRRKTCLKGDFYKNLQNFDVSGDLILIDDLVRESSSSESQLSRLAEKLSTSSSSHVFYIGVGCACGAIVVTALAILACYVRSRKPGTEHFSDTSSATALSHDHVYQRAETPSRSVGSGAPSTVRRGPTPISYSELRPSEARSVVKEIAINRNCISLIDILMEGTFGRIYLGTLLTTGMDDVDDKRILVKTVTDQARPDQVDVMIKEGSLMKGIRHPNINSLIASCFDNEHQPLLIYPFLDEGNLKKFLQRCRMSDIGINQSIGIIVPSVIRGRTNYFEFEVSDTEHNVHEDLENPLGSFRVRLPNLPLSFDLVLMKGDRVDSQLTVQLTDMALARDLFPRDYHCLGDNENRPVKWLALEALVDRKFCPASDVWAFGVTLWELMTLGLEPYADIDPFEMATYLKQGYRVSQPVSCPNELFAVMACCWAANPDERPKFGQLQMCLQDFYSALSRYV